MNKISTLHIAPISPKIFEGKISLLLFFIALFSTFPSIAQHLETDDLTQSFVDFQKYNLQEKVYVHTDKDFYQTGESIWFKIYLTDAIFHKPLDISKIVYVEIVDNTGLAIRQAKIAMAKGFGNGSFELENKIPTGNYTFRAYTNWMKNFPSEFFFEKQISIVNTDRIAEKVESKDIYEFNIFPEGGNLINGIESRVAFLGQKNGKGAAFKGFIIDNESDTLFTFSNQKFGMGDFYFKPEIGKKYQVSVLFDDDYTIEKELPKPMKAGYVLSLKEQQGNVFNLGINSSKNDPVFLLIHTRGILKSYQLVKIKNQQADVKINKSTLGEGISVLTLLDANKNPLCERLVFKYPEQQFVINPVINKTDFAQREKVKLELNSLPVSANMSLAVYELDSLQRIAGLNIQNYLWLCSDLKGDIESPDYYFDSSNKGRDEALDLLLLTQGWRRFEWQNIHSKSNFTYPPEFLGHFINGKIADQKNNEPVEAYLSIPDKGTRFKATRSDSTGRVRFEMNDFYTKGEIITQATAGNQSYFLEIQSPFSEQKINSDLPDLKLAEIPQADFYKHHMGVQVQDKFQKEVSIMEKESADVPFYGKPDYQYQLDDYVRFPSMEEVLREYVVPVLVRKDAGKFHLILTDDTKGSFFELDPMILLDGLPILDADKIMEYNPLHVEYLDIMTHQYHFGNKTYNGVLNFQTYTGNLPGFKLDAAATVIDYEGLQKQRIFYSPVYESAIRKETRLPDFRNLLYWNPDVKSDTSGKAVLDFYTSDVSGNFVIIIQGITEDGKTGFGLQKVKVKTRE